MRNYIARLAKQIVDLEQVCTSLVLAAATLIAGSGNSETTHCTKRIYKSDNWNNMYLNWGFVLDCKSNKRMIKLSQIEMKLMQKDKIEL